MLSGSARRLRVTDNSEVVWVSYLLTADAGLCQYCVVCSRTFDGLEHSGYVEGLQPSAEDQHLTAVASTGSGGQSAGYGKAGEMSWVEVAGCQPDNFLVILMSGDSAIQPAAGLSQRMGLRRAAIQTGFADLVDLVPLMLKVNSSMYLSTVQRT